MLLLLKFIEIKIRIQVKTENLKSNLCWFVFNKWREARGPHD